ncbi:GNAT family N-acetyltransferase [Massilia endophytica]|uniref:GNAT family N-acetyltransferase n=1 Tax=Massilia endophytica TaxID=2899220 RepID=UPI001E3D4BD7|nr:GNAT family N-acetyltransferase [Massilia endophytica]UGQ47566.1 GNAT family N-acetyltransferase [Massilia endophytica]
MNIAIRGAAETDLPAFFTYLDDHLKDNGANGTPLFQPMPRGASRFPAEKQGSFVHGLATPLDGAAWRRLWLALDGERICGHVDLRARTEAAARHRMLLGMGVDRAARRCGLGQRLLDTAIAWAEEQPGFGWVDLEVLSANEPARALYRKRGFVQTGEIPDLFRIDGETLGYTYMSLALERQAG